MLVLLIVGSSAIYTSASITKHPLSDWYKQSFETEAERWGEFTGSELIRIVKELNQVVTVSSKEIGKVISETFSTQLMKSTASITDYQKEIEAQLEQTVNRLSEEDLSDEIDNSTIELEVEEDIENILKEVLENN